MNLLWFGLFVAGFQTGDVPCNPIRSIRIENMDVFGSSPEPRFYHRWMQVIHHTTRESVIRREVLVHEGDCVDLDLIAETKRNLRALPFLAEADLVIEPSKDGSGVDLVVVTIDRFTLRSELSFSRKGSLNKTRGSLGEKNLLGLGLNFHFSQSARSDGSEIKKLVFEYPRLFKQLKIGGNYSTTDEGVYREFSLEKPFWQMDDRHAFSVRFIGDHTRSDYYRDGGTSIEIPNDNESSSAAWDMEMGSLSWSRRMSLEVGHLDLHYQPVDGLDVPPPTKGPYLQLGMDLDWRRGFKEMRGIDAMQRIEDIEEHTFLSMALRQWDRQREGNRQYQQVLRIRFLNVSLLGSQWLWAAGLDTEARFQGSQRLAMSIDAFTHGYRFLPHRQSLVAGVAFRASETDDGLYLPLLLGEDLGLRGYKAFGITGNRTLLINLEHRWVYPWKTAHTAWGQCVFVDAGSAWKPDQAMAIGELHWGLGWGIRLDMPALFGNHVFRVDLAHGLDGETFSISASAGHVFRHDKLNHGFSRDY